MDSDREAGPEVTRVPTKSDLMRLCAELNARGVRYVVIGGVAMIELGLMRATHDIDLLVADDDENVRAACEAIATLPDRAAAQVAPSDLREFTVVRINDAITVDLMGRACGLAFADAEAHIERKELDGVWIPFASARLLWRTKQTWRIKDALDRNFLRKWAADRGVDLT